MISSTGDRENVPVLASAGDVGAVFTEPVLEWLGAKNELDELVKLKENWDSYGALPVDHDSVLHARRLLLSLWGKGIPCPTVTASPAGNAAFCWDDGAASVDVEVMGNGLFHVVHVDHKTGETREFEYPVVFAATRLPGLVGPV